MTAARSRTVIRSLQADARILGAQPNFLYLAASRARRAAADPAQYALGKLRLPEAHALAKGESMRVAVIDTTIDAKHPGSRRRGRGVVRRNRRAPTSRMRTAPASPA